MQFLPADIQHIADLARLDLMPVELASYGTQLSDITGYIDQLKIVSAQTINNTDPSLTNVWREDKVQAWNPEENWQALSQGELEAGLIKVKRVL